MFKHRVLLPITIALNVVASSNAQSTSGNAMQFLDVAQSTRLVGAGGLHTVAGTSTSSLVFHNAGAVADSIAGSIDLNISPVTEGIKYASAAYTDRIEGIGTITIGLLYASFGEFERRDEDNIQTGVFTANEGAIYLSYSKQLSPWLNMGATVKPMFSKMADNTAVGLAFDLGATGSFADNRFIVAASIRNVGGIIKKYTDDTKNMSLPFDIRLGLAYKAEHAPFRFLLTIKDLTHLDLSTSKNKIDVGDNILRHMLFGLEFVPVKAFYFSMGYDHRQRRELTASDVGGMAGFSWGAGLEIAKIKVQYAHSRYHAAGSLNSITLATNIRRFMN